MSILWAYALILSPPSLRSAIDPRSAPLPLNLAGAIPPSMASALSLAFDSVWFGFLLFGFCLPCVFGCLHFSLLPLALMMAIRSVRVSAPGGACPFLIAGAMRRPNPRQRGSHFWANGANRPVGGCSRQNFGGILC
jgi:hypothetical protein